MAKLTIDELARETGLTVRNVRNHQTRGILPGPKLEGRVGYYGDEHVERLRLIRRLQDDGISLRAIESLLLTRAETADRMNALRLDALSQLSQVGPPQRLTLAEARERFGDFDETSTALALQLHGVTLEDDGTFVVRHPALLGVLDQAIDGGLSLEGALGAATEVQELSQRAASYFVNLIRRELWEPFDEAGQPDGQWPAIAEGIGQVRPLAAQIFMLMLPEAIDGEIEKAFGEEFSKQATEAEASAAPPTGRAPR